MDVKKSKILSFNNISKLYDNNRPSYPEELINGVIKISKITSKSNILDIGCGTGKATIMFAKTKADITALDISLNMIAVGKEKSKQYSNIKYFVSSFEDIKLDNNYFDLIICAQSFHFLDHKIALTKISKLLKRNGYLVIFSNFPDIENNNLLKDISVLYKKYCESFPKDYGSTQKIEHIVNRSGLFCKIKKINYSRLISNNKDSYLNLVKTLSYVQILNKDTKEELIKGIQSLLEKENDIFELPCITKLLITKKLV